LIDNVDQSKFLLEKDASAPLIAQQEYQRIEKILHQIPEDQAAVIRLRVLDNLSFIEIAALLEQPVTTVKSRFKYGMDKLKDFFNCKKAIYEL
jgi:RNA polymerase sigma-70 factor (ECF subfamily)